MARAKSAKNKQRLTPSRPDAGGGDSLSAVTAHNAFNPPTKKPSLLATSVILFGLWFVYLIVVALSG